MFFHIYIYICDILKWILGFMCHVMKYFIFFVSFVMYFTIVFRKCICFLRVDTNGFLITIVNDYDCYDMTVCDKTKNKWNIYEHNICVGNIRWSFHVLLEKFYVYGYVYIWLCNATWWFVYFDWILGFFMSCYEIF